MTERLTLVYGLNNRHFKNLVTAFRRAGVQAVPLTGSMTRLERGRTLQDFLSGDFSFLVRGLNLIESVSMPNVSCSESLRTSR